MPTLRLDAFLSAYTRYSRREAAALIRAGKVTASGVLCHDGAAKIDPAVQEIRIGGAAVPYRAENTLMLYKPAGTVSATQDEDAPTVLSLLREEDAYPQPVPAGRLDKDTTGLLILTSDGDFCHRVISPKSRIWKTYRLTADGILGPEDAARIAAGLETKAGERFLPGHLTVLEAGPVSLAEIRICEGRYHEVKRMLAALGKPVLTLKRTAIGALRLDETLAPGGYRRLTEEEKALALVSEAPF